MTFASHGGSNRQGAFCLLIQGTLVWGASAVLSSCAAPATALVPNGMSREEFALADSVRASDATWRVATTAESGSQAVIDELRRADESYQPYLCRSVAGSRVVGFGFVLTRADTFKVMYSRSDEDGAIMTEVARATWLKDGQISCREDELDIAPLRSDEVLSFRWNRQRRRMELLQRESSEFEEPSA